MSKNTNIYSKKYLFSYKYIVILGLKNKYILLIKKFLHKKLINMISHMKIIIHTKIKINNNL